jgi:hypothetical protein
MDSESIDAMIDWLDINCSCGERVSIGWDEPKICPKCGRGYIELVVELDPGEEMNKENLIVDKRGKWL